MKTINKILMAALCSTAMTTPAFAQDAAQEAETFDDNVIIVTATRRAEDVQDIPIAVTAVSPAQLEQQGVVNVQNIGSVSPSFSTSNAQTASGTVVLRIRGVGTTSNNIGFESAVGIFVDGAYQSRPGVALGEFVDVERVEVLRGPQGTLFGRNTSAGALNITNVRPDLNDFGGFVNATYGNFDHMSIQGAINAPLIEDNLALRVTGAYRKRDGYVRTIDATGATNGESNNTDQYLIRGQLGFETDGGISGRLIADYSKSTASCCAAVEVYQSPVETSGAFALVGLGARGGMAAPAVAVNPFDTTTMQRAVDNRLATQSFQSMNSNDQWGVTAEVEVPVSDSADLVYIGSYREFRANESYDSDFSGLDIFNVLPGGGTSIDTMTHELRLQGDALDGALSWLVGGYYSDEDISQVVNFGLGDDYDALVGALFGGAAGPAPLALFSGGVDASTVRATNAYTQSSKSWSIFTHNTLEVAEGLKLTVGLRYSDESKDGGFTQPSVNNALCPAILSNLLGSPPTGAAPAPPLGTTLGNGLFGTGCFAFTAPADLPQAVAVPLPRSFTGTFSDEELIYTGKVSYEFASPVTVYASFTHGYKSGGFNLDSTAAVGGSDPSFLSEEVDAYEIGFKGKFLDNALTVNIAGFHEEFSNFQVLEFTGAQFTTFNVPKAKSSGVELEMQARPSDNLTINGGLTYTDARYPEDCAGSQTSANVLSLCGNSLTNAPKWVSILGATYDRDLGSSLKFFVNGQVRMESDRRTSTQAIVVPGAADIAAAGSVQAAVDAAPLVPFDVQDGNIKINMRAGIGDINDAWGIEAWVTNLTNEVTRGVTFNTVLRGSGAAASRSAFVQEPRMYGLTLRGKF
ncbi:TonB-dependent receptor [Sphingorhabdus sp. SMR4y]|uniref:TonB-dependent receptor n=1 Tax=Sphingorhabdus sp. SMR4y TaxID=2584094 RepID=UPI000B61E004|nr:TonB-dependent receptor [Sphingorhabdus sp. SMR4y]ASK88274.1 FhuE receptor [Sphingorhabdus sp. SMR4y]